MTESGGFYNNTNFYPPLPSPTSAIIYIHHVQSSSQIGTKTIPTISKEPWQKVFYITFKLLMLMLRKLPTRVHNQVSFKDF